MDMLSSFATLNSFSMSQLQWLYTLSRQFRYGDEYARKCRVEVMSWLADFVNKFWWLEFDNSEFMQLRHSTKHQLDLAYEKLPSVLACYPSSLEDKLKLIITMIPDMDPSLKNREVLVLEKLLPLISAKRDDVNTQGKVNKTISKLDSALLHDSAELSLSEMKVTSNLSTNLRRYTREYFSAPYTSKSKRSIICQLRIKNEIERAQLTLKKMPRWKRVLKEIGLVLLSLFVFYPIALAVHYKKTKHVGFFTPNRVESVLGELHGGLVLQAA